MTMKIYMFLNSSSLNSLVFFNKTPHRLTQQSLQNKYSEPCKLFENKLKRNFNNKAYQI